MRESRTYGSVRGALSNERPYRNPEQIGVTSRPAVADQIGAANFLEGEEPNTPPEDGYPFADHAPGSSGNRRSGRPFDGVAPMEPPIGYGLTHRSIFPESQFRRRGGSVFQGAGQGRKS